MRPVAPMRKSLYERSSCNPFVYQLNEQFSREIELDKMRAELASNMSLVGVDPRPQKIFLVLWYTTAITLWHYIYPG